jgi:hypothetical protein
MHIPGRTEIFEQFEQGRSVSFMLDSQEQHKMHGELALAGQMLDALPMENSFAWSKERPTRRSVWLAARAGEEEFIADQEGLQEFDGDRAAGMRGLELLGEPGAREVFTRLKKRADTVLTVAALAIGIPEDFMGQCATRYRAIRYSGPQGGIGAHFDGNGLSAVLTNMPGLREIGYDGQVRPVSPNEISVMPGSSVHRLSRSSERVILPAFHDVARSAEQDKVSLAAFWNLPDKTSVPVSILGGEGADFYHDVGAMKNDDGPTGSLRALWERVADAHGISVEDLAASRFR